MRFVDGYSKERFSKTWTVAISDTKKLSQERAIVDLLSEAVVFLRY